MWCTENLNMCINAKLTLSTAYSRPVPELAYNQCTICRYRCMVHISNFKGLSHCSIKSYVPKPPFNGVTIEAFDHRPSQTPICELYRNFLERKIDFFYASLRFSSKNVVLCRDWVRTQRKASSAFHRRDEVCLELDWTEAPPTEAQKQDL